MLASARRRLLRHEALGIMAAAAPRGAGQEKQRMRVSGEARVHGAGDRGR
jgi:hypothetical protein